MTACLVYNASAQTWTGLGTDDLWSDAANWDTGVPDSNATSVVIGTAIHSESTEVTIASGDVENCANAVAAGVIFGPQWGSKLNIYGTLNFGWVMVPVQTDASRGSQSVINMYNGSSMNGNGALANSSTLCFGDTWWAAGGEYVILNMYGNAQVNVPLFAWGGQVNMYDTSTFTVTSIASAGTPTAGAWGMPGASDSSRLWNLAGGTVVLPTAYTATVTNWISRGIFLVWGKAYDTTDLSIADNGINTVVTVPALGALQNIYLGSGSNMMMVGAIQKPAVFGNFANVSGVPLSALDAAQLGGSTVVYHSTAPSVVSVSTNGVTAVSPGNATISATLGAFTSTNSVFITVTTMPNSLVHRYSFSETSGSTTADSIGGAAWNGTLYDGATLGGGQVTLDGSSGYVQLPAGIVSNMAAVTIEAWVNFGSPQAWAELYAFGAQDASFPPAGMNDITFEPFTGNNPPIAQATLGLGSGTGYEQAELSLVANGVTNYLGNVHLVCVYYPDAGYIAIYTNGELAAINNNVTYQLASTLGTDPINYLGQSLYGADPFLNASIDEFRIYQGPLTAAQIAADYALGPNQLIGTSTNVSLAAASAGDGNVVIKWPTTSALVTVMSSSVLGPGAVWTPVSNGTLTVAGGNYQMTIPVSGSAQFFRLQQ